MRIRPLQLGLVRSHSAALLKGNNDTIWERFHLWFTVEIEIHTIYMYLYVFRETGNYVGKSSFLPYSSGRGRSWRYLIDESFRLD